MFARIKVFLAFIMAILLWQAYKLRSTILEKYEEQELVRNSKFSETKHQRVLITVYYEALCPDSRSFITTELVPTYHKLEDSVLIQLIPYGKAQTTVKDDDYTFKCQHGNSECEANTIHACSIKKIQDPKRQLDVIACMMRSRQSPQDTFKSCAKEIEEYDVILNCSQSKEGRKLLAKYGELTQDLDPKVSFIPTITLDNDLNDEKSQRKLLKNLLSEVCERYEVPPKECES